MKTVSLVVESQVNIIVQPKGGDPVSPRGMQWLSDECQQIANERNKPVRVMFHGAGKATLEFKPVITKAAPDSAPLTPERKDLTGVTFISPNHSNKVKWTVERFHRGGAWVCREEQHNTTMHFYESDILEWSKPAPTDVCPCCGLPDGMLVDVPRFKPDYVSNQVYRTDRHENGQLCIKSSRGMIATMEAGNQSTRELDASFIVTACNSHAAHLAKIAALEGVLRDMLSCADVGDMDSMSNACDVARAALALPTA